MHLGFSSMNTADDPAPEILAKTLEEAGFESLWYGEHSHIPTSRKTPYPPGGEMPAPYRKMMDPYISLMAAASVCWNIVPRCVKGFALPALPGLPNTAKRRPASTRSSGLSSRT